MTNNDDDRDFAEWLESELEKKEWKPADLASRSGVDQGIISRLLNRKRGISNESLKSVARALGYSDVYIFRKTGILDPAPEKTAQTEELVYLFNQFPDDEKADLITYMRIKLAMLEKAGRIKT